MKGVILMTGEYWIGPGILNLKKKMVNLQQRQVIIGIGRLKQQKGRLYNENRIQKFDN